MKSIKVIEKVASKLAPGRAPYFIEAHVVKALGTIAAEGPVGRMKLSRTLGLGEGTTRTLVKHLRNERLIEISRSGIVLTDKGEKLFSNLRSRIGDKTEIPRSSLTVGPFNIAILVKNAADVVQLGLEQRDAAIKVGALGATTLIFSRGKLTMPGVNRDVLKEAPAVREVLISTLRPQEDDVIIIGSAEDKLTAEIGAIAASLETLKATD